MAGAVLALGVGAAPAAAHSGLEEASPGPGDLVAPGTDVVGIQVSEADGLTRDGRHGVTLTGPDGATVLVGGASAVSPTEVCARTEPLTPGVWTLDYELTGGDGHLVGGRYRFEVAADAAAATDGDEVVCPASGLAAPGEGVEQEGTSLLVTAGIPAVAGAAVGTMLLLLRRRPARPDDHGASEG